MKMEKNLYFHRFKRHPSKKGPRALTPNPESLIEEKS